LLFQLLHLSPDLSLGLQRVDKQQSPPVHTRLLTNANLECKLSAGVGTSLASTSSITFNGNKLTDGSVDHVDKKVYTPDETGSTFSSDNTKKEIDVGVTLEGADAEATAANIAALAALLDRGDVTDNGVKVGDIYTAATFDVEFTISFGAIANDIGLYLNTDNSVQNAAYSKFAVSPTATDTPITAKGFRMAFIPMGITGTGSVQKAVVFAGLQETETTTGEGQSAVTKTNIKYISSLQDTTLSGTEYIDTDYDLVDKDYHVALPGDSTTRSDAIARPDYLGFFKFAEGTRVSLKYRVVAWFEGTDPEIVNRSLSTDYQAVASTLVFDAVSLNAASNG